MADNISTEERSQIMSLIRHKDTKPEMIVRKIIYHAGYRYRLHDKTLPGKPDLVFTSRRKAIFVHGCFWHQHESCKNARIPKSRTEYWHKKLEENKSRDQKNLKELEKMNWDIFIIWECELKNLRHAEERLVNFLSTPLDKTKSQS